jgi:RNA polymerase sigma-70 factor (family 1)
LAALETLTDTQLLFLIKEGDRAAYAAIYDRYIFVLLNHTYNKTRDREAAKDIVQDVFTRLWTGREVLMVDTNLSGYLYTACRNLILNQVAHKEVRGRYLLAMEQFSAKGQVLTDHLVRERQLLAVIEQEIAALPPKMREVFELSRKQYLSHKAIAEQLQISEQTVSKQVSNALKILRLKLGPFVYLAALTYFK